MEQFLVGFLVQKGVANSYVYFFLKKKQKKNILLPI